MCLALNQPEATEAIQTSTHAQPPPSSAPDYSDSDSDYSTDDTSYERARERARYDDLGLGAYRDHDGDIDDFDYDDYVGDNDGFDGYSFRGDDFL